jgi:hypothetical protein
LSEAKALLTLYRPRLRRSCLSINWRAIVRAHR